MVPHPRFGEELGYVLYISDNLDLIGVSHFQRTRSPMTKALRLVKSSEGGGRQIGQTDSDL